MLGVGKEIHSFKYVVQQTLFNLIWALSLGLVVGYIDLLLLKNE